MEQIMRDADDGWNRMSRLLLDHEIVPVSRVALMYCARPTPRIVNIIVEAFAQHYPHQQDLDQRIYLLFWQLYEQMQKRDEPATAVGPTTALLQAVIERFFWGSPFPTDEEIVGLEYRFGARFGWMGGWRGY